MTKEKEEIQKLKATLKILNKEREKEKEPMLVLSGDEILGFKTTGAYSTGIESMNEALNGGYHEGRIYELAGQSSAGKSSVSLCNIKEFQNQGHQCCFIDMEHTFDANYAMACGVDLNKLLLVRPQTAEEAMRAVNVIARSGVAKLIVVDSVAQLIPQAEAEKDMEKESIGLQARFITKALKKIIPSLQVHGAILILINQFRTKLEGMYASRTTSGGNMLHYACTGRLEIKRTEWLGSKDNIHGQRCQIKVTKHKMGPPMRTCEIDIIFGEGVDSVADLANVLLDTEFTGIEKSGGWIKLDGETLCQGKDNFIEYLRNNEKEREELRARFRKVLNTNPIERPALNFKSTKSKSSKKDN